MTVAPFASMPRPPSVGSAALAGRAELARVVHGEVVADLQRAQHAVRPADDLLAALETLEHLVVGLPRDAHLDGPEARAVARPLDEHAGDGLGAAALGRGRGGDRRGVLELAAV